MSAPSLTISYDLSPRPILVRSHRKERSATVQEAASPRLAISAETLKGAKKRQLEDFIYNKLTFQVDPINVEELSQNFIAGCLMGLKNLIGSKKAIVPEKHVELGRWIWKQAEGARKEQPSKPHWMVAPIANLGKLLQQLEAKTVEKTTESLQTFKELIKDVRSKQYASILDFALYCKTVLNALDKKHREKMALLFYKAVSEQVLEFFLKWPTDPVILKKVALAFYMHIRTHASEILFEGSVKEFDRLKISYSDVRRHLIHENKLIIQKIVINDCPLNYLDLVDSQRVVKEGAEVKFYERLVEALTKSGLPASDCAHELMTILSPESCNSAALKIMQLMQAGTINFFVKAHEQFLGSLQATSSVKVVADAGTTWNIHIESATRVSLTQIKTYKILPLAETEDWAKLFSATLYYTTQFDFQNSDAEIKSVLSIPMMAAKENLNPYEQELLLKVLDLQH